MSTPFDLRRNKVVGNIGPINSIQFNLTPAINPPTAPAEGLMYWNEDDGTLNLGMPGGDVNLQIGQEQLIRAKNTEGVQIDNGQAVYVASATGAVVEVKLANASELTSEKTIAIATEDVTNNQQGYFTTFGMVRDIDTTFAASEGDVVYLDATDGGLTTTMQAHPSLCVCIGYVARRHASEGVLFVTIDAEVWRQINQSMREPTGFDTDQSTLRGDISFTNTGPNRTFQIDVQGGESYFNFWISGREYRRTSAETLQIAPTEGLHYIYYNASAALAEAVNPSDADIDGIIRTLPIVAILYWNNTNNEYIWLNDERHLTQMDGSTHSNIHFTRGTQWLSGGALGDFDIDDTANDSGAQFSYSAGSILDEDIDNREENIAYTVGNEILYLSNGDWRRITQAGFSVLTDTTAGLPAPTGRLVYNDVSTPGSEVLTAVTDNKYVLCHILQTNGATAGEKVFAVVGQAQYTNLNNARLGANTEVNNLITTGLPGPEFIFLGTVIFQTKNTYTNSVNATVRLTDLGGNYVDWRQTELSPSAPATNHSALSGLSNDDHLQYILTDGSRDFTGDQSLGGNSITNGLNAAFLGHVGLGPNSGVSANYVNYTWEAFTNQTGVRAGTYNLLEHEPAGAMSAICSTIACYNQAHQDTLEDGSVFGYVTGAKSEGIAWQSGNVNTLLGSWGVGRHQGSGTATNVIGVKGTVMNDDPFTENGNITNAFSLIAAGYTDKGTGTMATRYGLYVEDVTGGGLLTNQYGIYCPALAGASGDNIFIKNVSAASDFGSGDISTTGTVTGINITSGADPGHTHDARYYTETETDTNFLKLDCSNDPLTNTLDGAAATFSGTIQAEQLTSTDDITMQGHLFTLGNNSAADVVLSFDCSNNDATITFDESEDEFLLGDADLTTTGTMSCTRIEGTTDGVFGGTLYFQSGHIVEDTNDLIIENDAEDQDIIFKVNDGAVDTEVMRIDGSTSNVGIGATSPGAALHIYKLATGNDIKMTSLGLAATIPAASNYGTIVMHSLDASGNGPMDLVQIKAYQQVTSGFAYGALGFYTAFANVDSAPVERMTISALGDVGIGSTGPTHRLEIWGDSANYIAEFFNNGNNANRNGLTVQCGADNGVGQTFYFNALAGAAASVGYIEQTAGGVFQLVDVSDKRLKKDIRDTDNVGKDIIKKLKIKKFKKRESKLDVEGFIAQEVKEVYPQAVSEFDKDGETYYGITKTELIAPLIKCVQEQQEQIDDLTARIEKLEKGKK